MGQYIPSYVLIAVVLVFNAMVVKTAPISGTENDNGKDEVSLFHPHQEFKEEAPIPNRNRDRTELMGHHLLMTDNLMRTDLSPAVFDTEGDYAYSHNNNILYRTQNRNILNKFHHVAKRHVRKRHSKKCDLKRITVEMLIRFFKTGHFCSSKTVRFRFGVAK